MSNKVHTKPVEGNTAVNHQLKRGRIAHDLRSLQMIVELGVDSVLTGDDLDSVEEILLGAQAKLRDTLEQVQALRRVAD